MAQVLPQIRVGFIGDSITHGTGDETLLGWPIRVAQAARADGYDVVPYNLGVRADTSELVAARWEAECDARLPEPFKRATVFAVGINDSAHEKSRQMDGPRVELDRSTDLIISMIKTAGRFGPSLWVGPTPVIEAMMPLSPFKGLSYRFANDAIARHNDAYAARAAAEGIEYLDLFSPLSAEPGWEASLRTTDGLHPGSGGYVLMADLFAKWPAWQAVLGGLKR